MIPKPTKQLGRGKGSQTTGSPKPMWQITNFPRNAITVYQYAKYFVFEHETLSTPMQYQTKFDDLCFIQFF